MGAVFVLALLLVAPDAGTAQSLRGSAASLDRQNAQARAHSFSYLETADDVRRFVESGYLVPLRPNADLEVHRVSFPYTRPEGRLFIRRLASQYRSACGEKLVVTSLTRPNSHQPANASSRSVHPTGMAIDLRRSGNPRCRSWLESTLISLQASGVAEAIYERNPPHYHVAIFPQPYTNYLAERGAVDAVAALDGSATGTLDVEWVTHRVARGENLTAIARRYDSTVARIQAENGLRGTRIAAGQELRVPVYRDAPAARSAVAAAEPDAAEATLAVDEGADSQSGATFASDDAGGSAAASRSSGSSVSHRVSRGESLWGISRLYGVSQAAIRQANRLDGSRIVAGQELEIPGVSRTAARVVEHRVSRGDSLWSIARRHGVSVTAIRRYNGIGGSRIMAGQVLEIPVEG